MVCSHGNWVSRGRQDWHVVHLHRRGFGDRRRRNLAKENYHLVYLNRKTELRLIIHLSIHSGYFYSASSRPLLLRRASDTARILYRGFHAEAPQATASEGLAQGPYVAARAGVEPTTLRMKGVESTNEPPRPTIRLRVSFYVTLSTHKWFYFLPRHLCRW